MKYFLFIVFFSMSLFTLAQHTFELCAGESKTVTYFSETNSIGSNTWTINGMTYITEELTYTFTNIGTYNIILKRENGPCYVEESLQVVVTECPGIIYWVPNTFTPDGNEFNQTFGPIITEGIDVNDFNFTVFNRWGEVVWESNDLNNSWDGMYNNKMCPDGVYTWKLTFNVFNNDGKITNHGFICLIR